MKFGRILSAHFLPPFFLVFGRSVYGIGQSFRAGKILLGLVVVSESQLDELGEHSDIVRTAALYAETAEIYTCDTSVRMNLHARLVAPEVDILVEIPVRSYRP